MVGTYRILACGLPRVLVLSLASAASGNAQTTQASSYHRPEVAWLGKLQVAEDYPGIILLPATRLNPLDYLILMYAFLSCRHDRILRRSIRRAHKA